MKYLSTLIMTITFVLLASMSYAATISIAVVNQSSIISNTDMPNIIAAIQTQMTRDYQGYAGYRAGDTINVHIPINNLDLSASWQVYIVDNQLTVGGIHPYGYHDWGNEPYNPWYPPVQGAFAYVTTYNNGVPTVFLSHEILEMTQDPKGTGREICDRLEDIEYFINGVGVSDFLLKNTTINGICTLSGWPYGPCQNW